jgi:5'-nucleotidase
MKFLLVNDDGYNQQGILLAERILKKFGEVYVVAPQEPQSGKSCSIIYGKHIDLIKYDDHHYALAGTPANCTLFGLFGLNVNFDLVISGVNDGYNLANDTMYSGTIGACSQALLSNFPAIAFSSYWGDFTNAEKYLEYVLDYILKNQLYSSEYMLNVNFHKGDDFKGIQLTRLYDFKMNYRIENSNSKVIDYRSNIFLKSKKGTDAYAVTHGYISITPLYCNQFKVSVKNIQGRQDCSNHQ